MRTIAIPLRRLRIPIGVSAATPRRRYIAAERRRRREPEGHRVEPSASETSKTASAEERTLAALRAGDEDAFLALVNRYHGAMLRVASLYVKSRATAEEVVQDAWLGVLKGLRVFEGRSTFKSWLFHILVNCAKTRSLRDGRTVPLSSLAAVDGDEEPSVSPDRFLEDGERWAGGWARPPGPWPDAAVESGELLALVREALETLPEVQRTVMTLRDVDGWDSDEVCELLGLSEVNQRVLLHRARSRVRGYVEARLGEEGAA